jgi:dipeptidyl aminopeptidase/acylaminoacyl peptidase
MILLRGHKARVHSLAFSPDGTLLVSASGNSRRVWLWDVAARKPRAVLGGHRERVTSLAVSSDGRLLASADQMGTIKLRRLPAGEDVSLSLPGMGWGGAGALAFAPDSRTLAVAAHRYGRGMEWENGIRRWDVQERAELPALVYGPRGYAWFRSLAFAPDGRTLAVGSYGTVSFWDLSSNRCHLLRRAQREAHRIRYSPDGRTLAIAWGPELVLWDVATQQQRASWEAHQLMIRDLAFTPDSRLLLTVSGDRLLKVWDAAGGGERAALSWNVGKLYSVAVAPDGMTAAAGGDTDIVLWDLDQG